MVALGAVAALGLLAAGIGTYAELRSFLVDRVDASLEAARGPLLRLLIERSRTPDADSAAFAAAAPGAYVEVRNDSGNVVARTPPAPSGSVGASLGRPRLPDQLAVVTGPQGSGPLLLTVSSNRSGGPEFRVRADPLQGGGTLVVALPLNDVSATLDRLLVVELIVAGVVLAGAIGLGGWLVRVGLRPLGDIEVTAARIAGGDLAQRIDRAEDGTEIGRLGGALNAMLGQIEESFDRQAATEERLRRFVADASHELRTPVAAVAAYAELFERGADQRPEDLQRVLRGIRAETRRMAVLVDDLLLLARLDEGRPLAPHPADLVALAGEAITTARALGPAWPVAMEASGPVEAEVDSVAMRQVLDNLLANVRVHTPVGTRTTVRVHAAGENAVIEVVDNGPGLAPEDAARIFERFYRVDRSRSRERGGSGLGLAVVRALVEAHHGRVELTTAPGYGATFRVIVPRQGTAAGEPAS